jgi:hypothetical protein
MAIQIQLPILHQGQVRVWRNRKKFNTLRCGRRWGKTKFFNTLASDAAIKGRAVGFFAPEHKQLQEPYEAILDILSPIRRRASKNEGTIRTTTGGLVDFWQLTDNELAGRGREYDLVLIDEAGFTKKGQMLDIWNKSIRPTMLTKPDAQVWVGGTPKGEDADDFFFNACNDPDLHFAGQHHAPSSDNPYVPPEEIERERQQNHPLVFQQEFLAEWVSWTGVAFFSLEKLLVDGRPVEYPKVCDSVFAVIDSAVKGGQEHDGTAVTYWATSKGFGKYPLICLDYDIISIDGALLETWIPTVFARCEELAKECRARFGSAGVWIEDAASGSILLQQCVARRLPAQALPAVLTSAGKDARAMNASGPVYRGEVKLSRYAYDKNDVEFKGAHRNHLVSQVTGFRIGDKDAHKRADDLLDTFVYSIAITIGNNEGIA